MSNHLKYLLYEFHKLFSFLEHDQENQKDEFNFQNMPSIILCSWRNLVFSWSRKTIFVSHETAVNMSDVYSYFLCFLFEFRLEFNNGTTPEKIPFSHFWDCQHSKKEGLHTKESSSKWERNFHINLETLSFLDKKKQHNYIEVFIFAVKNVRMNYL